MKLKSNGIKTLINLQQPGEHSSCGPSLENSGFTYQPQIFMESNVFFYNFVWKDYGTMSNATLLDMVKVMAFALTEGKVAVHCHAGLGRTGVLIGCFLIYSLRCKPNDTIRYIRSKRPHSIQTRSQITCVQQFAQFIIPLFTVFSNVIHKSPSFTLNQYLNRQKKLLHGYEARHLKYIPKIVYLICERLLELSNSQDRFLERTQSSFGSVSRYHLQYSAGFWNNFLSATSPDEYQWRPLSQLTLQLSSEHSGLSPVPPQSQRTSPCNSRESSFEHAREDASRVEHWVDSLPNIMGNGTRTETTIPKKDPSSSKASSSKNSESCGRQSSSALIMSDASNECLNDSQLSYRTSGSQRTTRTAQSSYLGYYPDFDPESSDDSIDSVLMEDDCREDLLDNTCYRELSSQLEMRSLQEAGTCNEPIDTNSIVEALLLSHNLMGSDFNGALRQFQRDLNTRGSAWDRITTETDPVLLAGLLWSWLDHLREPILNKHDLTHIVIKAGKPVEALQRLDRGTRYTTEYFLRFLIRLHINSLELRNDLLRRIVSSLTHQCLIIRGSLQPTGMQWTKMREGTSTYVMQFVKGLCEVLSGVSFTVAGEEIKHLWNSTPNRTRGVCEGLNIMASAIGRGSTVLR
ncbi:protein tyrosine phosphatase domain-containing protein 1-like isoform X2 [Tachypleus tridentatus]|uniref:protein tyrosine phosphatase domain-containing protein 1-like isoform X2 n=1 Tax=Tachypleus tridentatus TaxID=6853 RepID=UPI003FCF2336